MSLFPLSQFPRNPTAQMMILHHNKASWRILYPNSLLIWREGSGLAGDTGLQPAGWAGRSTAKMLLSFSIADSQPPNYLLFLQILVSGSSSFAFISAKLPNDKSIYTVLSSCGLARQLQSTVTCHSPTAGQPCPVAGSSLGHIIISQLGI